MSHDRFDDALARTLTETASTTEPCPDAAALAAFSEHALSTPERATVEAHVASCLRCQAHLAALARAATVETTASAQPRKWAWSLDWRWVTPVAATAVVVLSVWVIDPAQLRPGQAAPDREVQLLERAQLDDGLRERSSPAATPVPAETVDDPAPTAASAAESTNTAPTAATSAQARRDVIISPGQAPRQRAELAQELDAMIPEVEEALGSVALERRVALADVSEMSGVLIVSGTPGTSWRVGATVVERSTDGGVSWTAHPLPTASALLAGSSPTERVCWIVGANGTIVRTGDAGETWDRVAPPQPGTYTDVEARDVDTATVTRDDGARFTTADGGVTWTVDAAESR